MTVSLGASRVGKVNQGATIVNRREIAGYLFALPLDLGQRLARQQVEKWNHWTRR
jgi:hypothetical protein